MTAAVYYGTPFYLPAVQARTPLGTLTLGHAGESNITVNLSALVGNDSNATPSSWFWHLFHSTNFAVVGNDPNATTRYPHYSVSSLARSLNTYVQIIQALIGWPESNFEALWGEELFGVAKPHYSFTNGSAFTYQFSTMAGAALFGHNGTLLSASTAFHVLGNATPTFVVFPSSQSCSASAELDALDYEPQGGASHVVADDGTGYGNSRSCSYFHRDWQQRFETPEKMFRAQASSTHPFTFQHLIEHCRSSIPFYVAHGFGGPPVPQYPVFVLRDSGNFFRPQSESLANHAQLRHDFRTIAVGSLQSPT